MTSAQALFVMKEFLTRRGFTFTEENPAIRVSGIRYAGAPNNIVLLSYADYEKPILNLLESLETPVVNLTIDPNPSGLLFSLKFPQGVYLHTCMNSDIFPYFRLTQATSASRVISLDPNTLLCLYKGALASATNFDMDDLEEYFEYYKLALKQVKGACTQNVRIDRAIEWPDRFTTEFYDILNLPGAPAIRPPRPIQSAWTEPRNIWGERITSTSTTNSTRPGTPVEASIHENALRAFRDRLQREASAATIQAQSQLAWDEEVEDEDEDF